MPDDAPTTKPVYYCSGKSCPGLPYRPSDMPHPFSCSAEGSHELTPAQREALDLADALEALDRADDRLGVVADLALTTEERADLDGALMHLAKVQRSLQQRRDGRGT